MADRSARIGAAFGLASAVLYTAANVKLKDSVGVDPFVVAAVKAVPTVVCLAPVVLYYLLTRRPLGTSYAMVPRFAAVALFGQFVGNAAFQVSLSHIGLAVAVPITLGTLIVGGGLLGRLILKEPVGVGKLVSMAILIVAVLVLAFGDVNSQSTAPRIDPDVQPVVWYGALCAMAGGAAYSLFGVVMRQTLRSGLSMPATMFVSGLIGMLGLWSFCLARTDLDEFSMIPSEMWWNMGAAGILNFAAFAALSGALGLLPVVAVNLINASQVAMATIAGWWLFHEALTPTLLSGITLTVLGLIVLAISGRWASRSPSNRSSTPTIHSQSIAK